MTTVERIQLRRGTTAEWTESNPVLAFGEIGIEITTASKVKFKIGNGTSVWSTLNYFENVTDLNLSQYATDAELAAALSAYVPLTQKGAANGVATLDSSSKIPHSQLPALSITDTFVVNSQANMLALTAQTGDIAVRTDLNKSFILIDSPATTLANWQELLSPPNAVTSVNGETGAVSLSIDDISDVDVQPGVASGHYLAYNSGNQKWESKALPTVETDNFVTLDGEQTIRSKKIFNSTGTTNGLEINNTSLTFVGTGSLVVPGSTTPSQTAEGSVVWDTDSDLLTIGTGAGRKTFVDLDSIQTLTGKTLNDPTLNISSLISVKERVVIGPFAPGNVSINITDTPIYLFRDPATSSGSMSVSFGYALNNTNFTDANLAVGQSMTATVIVNNSGSFARFINSITTPNLTLTVRWLNGSAPTAGNIGAYDVYNFVIIKTASTAGLLLASLTRF